MKAIVKKQAWTDIVLLSIEASQEQRKYIKKRANNNNIK